MIRSPLRHVPLTGRILAYLEALQEPCHYTLLAQVLRRDATKVQQACWHLAYTHHLVRVQHGQYAITERGASASRGGER